MDDETMWNYFSRVYATYMEAFHFPMAQVLYDSLAIEKATNVLEVGTGGGYNLRQFMIQKPKSCQWYATDISDVMLSICQQRIEEFIKNPFEKINHNYTTEEPPKYEQKDFKELSLSFRKTDSRDLKNFQSNYFDRYFANQVVGGHKQGRDLIFKEAFRVLKPEGLLGITSFGRKENCKLATILKETAIEEGMDPTKFPPHDIFAETQKQLIIQQLEESGFQIQNCFYVCFPIFGADKICEVQLTEKTLIKNQFEKAGADQVMLDKIKAAAVKKHHKMIEETQSPITVEALYIIAKKPQQ